MNLEFGLILALCTVFILLVLVLYATLCRLASPAIMSSRAIHRRHAGQATLNIAGCGEIYPLTGVTLPFVSVGTLQHDLLLWGAGLFEGGGHPALMPALP